MIHVQSDRCPQDHPCPSVRLCPAGALCQVGFAAPALDEARCIDCGLCLRNCPYGVFQPNDSIGQGREASFDRGGIAI